MPRILISGYYGFNNAGDDIVLDGIITALRQAYAIGLASPSTNNSKLDPDHLRPGESDLKESGLQESALKESGLELAVLSNQPQITAELFGIEAYDRWSIPTIKEQLQQADLLIMGGGSLLQDVTSPRSVIYYLGIAWLALRQKKPIVFYAQGIGPINRRLSKILMKYLVNKVDIITVRDHKSLKELQTIGIHAPQMYLTADPALALEADKIDRSRGRELFTKYNIDTDQPIFGISVRVWKRETAYQETVARIADHMIESGWQVVFIAMHNPMDLATSQDVISLMDHGLEATVIDQAGLNFQDVTSMIANLDYMLGMRLHALILAGIVGLPFTALSYDPKINRFVESLGYPKPQHVENLDYEALLADIQAKQAQLEAESAYLLQQIAKVRPPAKETAQLALDLLNNRTNKK